jgi:urease accessory protein
MRSKILLLGVCFALSAGAPAYAHTGASAVFSFSSGFLHPPGGLDHLLAMFAVGLLAAQLGGRALWLVPTAFVAVMLTGALMGFAAVGLPGVEYAIALSLVVIALPVALALNVPAPLAIILVGVCAVFHGNAHGAELPDDAGMAAYMAGFMVATGFIHVGGIGFALLMKGGPTRAAAAGVGATGLLFLVA